MSPDLRTRAEVAQTPGLIGAQWPLGYLLGLGVVAALLAAAVLLLEVVELAGRDRLGELMLVRMGVSATELAWARAGETARHVLRAGIGAGVALALLVLAGPGLLDPVPRLAPAVRPIVDPLDWLVLAGLGLAVIGAGALIARRVAAGPAGEVLRGG